MTFSSGLTSLIGRYASSNRIKPAISIRTKEKLEEYKKKQSLGQQVSRGDGWTKKNLELRRVGAPSAQDEPAGFQEITCRLS